MIAVVDYRARNLTSVKRALDHLCTDAIVSRDPAVVAYADKIILPVSATSQPLPSWNNPGCEPPCRTETGRTVSWRLRWYAVDVRIQRVLFAPDEMKRYIKARRVKGHRVALPSVTTKPAEGCLPSTQRRVR
jgi:hypothetical protein